MVPECSATFWSNCSRFCEMATILYSKNYNETWQGSNIAWGKGDLVQEYDLKWPWSWEMAAMLQVTENTFLHFLWTIEPQNGKLFFNIICNFYPSVKFHRRGIACHQSCHLSVHPSVCLSMVIQSAWNSAHTCIMVVRRNLSKISSIHSILVLIFSIKHLRLVSLFVSLMRCIWQGSFVWDRWAVT